LLAENDRATPAQVEAPLFEPSRHAASPHMMKRDS
jgi:hypothetical protein